MLRIPRIDETDFEPLDSFPLVFRWNDARWNELPPEVMTEIRPLSKEKAEELLQYSLTFHDRDGLISEFFAKIEQTTCAGDNADTQKWLASMFRKEDSRVVVSWDKDTAVITTWGIFRRYWDDFCYPASDDIAIFPLSETWMLLYNHAEVFIVGERSA